MSNAHASNRSKFLRALCPSVISCCLALLLTWIGPASMAIGSTGLESTSRDAASNWHPITFEFLKPEGSFAGSYLRIRKQCGFGSGHQTFPINSFSVKGEYSDEDGRVRVPVGDFKFPGISGTCVSPIGLQVAFRVIIFTVDAERDGYVHGTIDRWAGDTTLDVSFWAKGVASIMGDDVDFVVGSRRDYLTMVLTTGWSGNMKGKPPTATDSTIALVADEYVQRGLCDTCWRVYRDTAGIRLAGKVKPNPVGH